ncbi:uncharacterized protein MELLADRAFT_34335 [Melampsora larici-populina 98AG31]|uniref:Probable enoyl-CoA hydratase, mitochondrial n=1 Tax=Melampsora larici-populina (strain 98AG31 / pathotype 3-4-7) TaxID=747676 RepID=F4RCL6_MELLP|nr:uncharacterized protein MELLADRAFT_34335 [Melampsora larici-populina 98AG31]EGG09754.1 hypothetical protein MELLADRAFT_34335 [Melampsora larici-populina 98AG31]
MFLARRPSRVAASLTRTPCVTLTHIRSLTNESHSYENISLTQPSPSVTLVTLNRPKALNALSSPLFHELNHAFKNLDAPDSQTEVIVLTGNEKAFAAGADIKEMKERTLQETYGADFLTHWTEITAVRKPIIAAVSGYALGGGCELAMMCDIILASPDATFGQPEINLGVIPGAGGTQRLTKAIGKSKAMEIVLTGRNFSAQDAYDWGLISRIVQGNHDELVKEAVKVAEKISSKGRLSVKAAKEAINSAYELPLREGLNFERRLFHMLFATNDQKEGMRAFAEKRKPSFTNS